MTTTNKPDPPTTVPLDGRVGRLWNEAKETTMAERLKIWFLLKLKALARKLQELGG